MSKSNSVGTKLEVDSVRVGGLTSIGGIEVSADATEVTDLGNEDGFKEYLPGFKDGGEVPVSGYLDGEDAGQDSCYALMMSGRVVPCKIIFPPKIGKTWNFNAAVTKFGTSVDVNDAVKFDATLKVSGKPTLARTASAASAG
jgi:hypothetical protein